jgi:hypothetical protein
MFVEPNTTVRKRENLHLNTLAIQDFTLLKYIIRDTKLDYKTQG